MLYKYTAADNAGRIIEGDVDATDLAHALQHLAGRELKPISVKPVKEARGGLSQRFFGRITIDDKVFLTKYLALMLRVGTDLLSAINILIADFDKPAVRNLLLEVRDNLTRGQPFYKAFESHPESFSMTFVSLVKAAETSGNLQGTFEELSDALVQEADLRSRVRAALIYPIVLLSMSFAILTFLVTFALPRIAGVFADAGIEPPFFSRIVFGAGLFIGDNILPIFVVFFSIFGATIYAYKKTVTGRRLLGQLIANLPLIKQIYRDFAIQRLASTMSSLMRAGLPIIQTINVAAATVGFSEYRFSLMRIANEGLAKGLTIGEAFKKEVVFPKVVTNLIAISEKAGHLEDVLATLAEFYAASVQNSIKSIVSLLEPLLLVLMGTLVALIALSIIVPIYQLTVQF